ncbi:MULTISPECIES: ArnT family glycosyltransferase [Bacteroides]|jgi:4-amino-4-deoxy-L-arabinose transferase-like glycosyltransferase|uniref:ArnT family glycosyltransferase n=1 Tax=Bacteroides TaxID=816 RepID=UPI000C785929|nr:MULTISPECIES: glycosyltransferase family 39 protein [Bacteroides]RGM48165.1 dolichyl-phosphate-mannose--protein mannosyltransferase [Bacteroides sp. OM08-11]
MSDKKKAFWFIALLSVLVIVPFLGETIFYSKGEPREAIVAYTMLKSGNWILPVNYGVEIAYKPPFLYWAIAVVSSIMGGVTEFSSRMPSALAFLAMQLVFFSFVAKRKNIKTAFLTSILLLSSFEVHRAAVACRLDMVQVSFIVIALCLLFRWDEKGSKEIPWLAVLLMACATLTKGPVGSIFPCVGIGIYQLLRGRSFGKTFFSLLGIGLLSLVPLGIWFWAAYQQGGESFINLMMEENTGRFFRKMSYASHENPLWYNFVTIIWGWIPWTLVLLISLFGLKWKEMRFLPEGSSWSERFNKAWTKFRSQSPLHLFTWVVILFIFIFYCIPKSKRSVYLLPIYPFMAMLIAEYFLALVQRKAKVFKISAYIFASLALLLTVTFIIVRFGLIPDSVWGTGKHAAENIGFMHALENVDLPFSKWLIVALPAIAGICTLIALVKRADTRSLLYSIAGCILCLFVSLDGVYQPTVLATKSDKRLAEQVNTYVQDGFMYSYTPPLIRFYCTNYYLNDRMRDFVPGLSGTGYVMLSKWTKEEFLKKYSDEYRLEEVYTTPYRSCDLRDKILIYKFSEK